MTRAALAALLSHWQRHPLQLFALVTGLALATALWSGVQAINAEARASYDAAAAVVGEGRFDQLVPRAGETIAQQTYIALRRAGWQVGPMLEGRFDADGERVRIVGIDPLTFPGGLASVRSGDEEPLPAFLSERVLYAHPDVADPLAAVVPHRVVSDPGMAPGTALTDIGVAQTLLNQPGKISRLIVADSQPLGRQPLDAVAPGLVRQPSQRGSEVGRLTDSFHLNLTALGLLSFAVGIFIVHSAIGLAFEQRRGMMRTLRALGMPLRRLVLLMVMELTVLALIAGGLGILLGYLLAASLLPDVAATLEGLYGAQVSGALHIRPAWWLSGLAIALAGTALAAAASLWRIARMPVLASATSRAWSVMAGRERALQAGAAALLLLTAAGLAFSGQGLIAAFAGLACLLIGAALALPLLLDRWLAFGQRCARRIEWEWFWADTRQQLPALSLALMALLLAMAANVGVSTMVSSFRLTFTGFLDQRLASDLYVSTESAEQGVALQDFLRPLPAAVSPFLYTDTKLADLPAELYGARVGPTYSLNWAFLASQDGVWTDVAAGKAVIVNEQLARRAGLWVGDTLAVTPEQVLPISGVVGDYGNPIGMALIGEALFRELFPSIQATQFGIRSDDPDSLRTMLTESFGLPEGSIIDQTALKDFSLQVFDRTFAVTAALNVLTLAVAGFAMLMSLLTLAAMRIPQLAPAWALGLTRRHLGRLELLRALALASMTLALALPLGLALSWMLLSVVNVEAFGWRLPLYLFPVDYAILGAVALLTALLAALWPARQLGQMPPASLLKVFANER
ncbi:MAG: FtsX-like permease family protein [Alphaproteobacteria bacterium]